MQRRSFLQLAAATPALSGTLAPEPAYKKVTRFTSAGDHAGMPGRYPGAAILTHSDKSIDSATGKVNGAVVREMLAQGMVNLTGQKSARDAWASFFEPAHEWSPSSAGSAYGHEVSRRVR